MMTEAQRERNARVTEALSRRAAKPYFWLGALAENVHEIEDDGDITLYPRVHGA